jgi:3-hydroxyacyl-[acyl-carrier-protein] dehydratase
MPPKAIIEPDAIPRDVVLDIEAIRKVNPQRFEMEQLTAITFFDEENMIIAGYKDIAEDEFWARGHMPGAPLMPGVLMLEAAAQVGSVFCHHAHVFPKADFVGLGGMEGVRFRGVVRPGDRLWMVGKVSKFSLRMTTFDFQGFVDGRMVFEAKLMGIPMSFSQAMAEGG